MAEYLKRLEVLIGQDNLKYIKGRHVLICGVGGVGSFVAEALARSGIGFLTLVDHDVIDPSNLNRQLMTTKDNIGLSKVLVLKQRLEQISDCIVDTKQIFIDEDFEPDDYDYVVDCIDSLKSKFALVKKCHQKKIPIISALGTAKRIKIENIKRTTLDKTRNDPLAKAFRNLVKKEAYHHKIDVVYIDSPPIQVSELGSSIFTVGSAGLFIAQAVFSDLLKMEEKNGNKC